jgi:AraC-like DNA-binding protein
MPDVFETSDIEVAHDLLVRTYGSLRLTVTGDRHLIRLVQHNLGPVQLHRNSFQMRFEVDGAPLRSLGFGRVLSGMAGYQTRQVRAGDLFLAGDPDVPYQSTIENADIEFAFIDPALLAQIADTAPNRAARPVRFLDDRPITPQAVAVWNASFDYVRDHVATNPDAAGYPLLSGNAARLLAATALSAFPNNALTDPTIEDRHDAHPTTLRRAITFIHDNAHRDISAADIAAAAHVTIRTLQLAFRRHRDTTPTAYLRRVRLKHAHHDLLNADPASTTVAAVAARWGFTNHSRFTAHYHATYGLPPSKTLRRR